MNSTSIFDDSWYRVRHLKLNLMPNIVFVRQKYRGEYWYVVCDEFGHRFFRIREETYFFICCLEQCASVEEAWEKSLKENKLKKYHKKIKFFYYVSLRDYWFW